MRDVFISHVEEDSAIALEIAQGLEAAGYTTWYYERDSIPGPSYLLQTGEAVEQARVFILLISPHSLGSNQVRAEVERAHESGRLFIPLLRGVTHAEFQARQPVWRQAVGTATSLTVPPAGPGAVLPRIIAGLQAMGIGPAGQAGGEAPRVPPPPPAERPRPVWQDIRLWLGALGGVAVLAVAVGVAIKLSRPLSSFKGKPTAPVGAIRPAAPTLPVPTTAVARPALTLASTAAPTIAAPSGPTSAATAVAVRGATLVKMLEPGSGRQLLWSPDGQRLILGGYGIYVYDTQTWKQVFKLDTQWVDGLALSPDGRTLATAASDGLTLWDMAAGGEIGTLEGSKDSRDVAFSPDGKTLATYTGETVKLWDLATHKALGTFPAGYGRHLAYAPDERGIAVGASTGPIKLIDPAGGQELMAFKGGTGSVQALAFSLDGKWLAASTSNDTAIRVWDAATGRLQRTLTAPYPQVECLAFSRDGRYLAGGSSVAAAVWELAGGDLVANVLGHSGSIKGLAFSPNGEMLATASQDGSLRVWSLAGGATPAPARTLAPLPTRLPLAAAAISPDSAKKLAQAQLLQGDRVRQILWSPDGRRLALGTYHIYLYDAQTWKQALAIEDVQWVDGLAFSPDGRTLASASYEGVRLWDVSTGGELLSLVGSKGSADVAFSPDGATLATFTGETIKLWNASDGKELRTIPVGWGRHLAYSPVDGSIAVGAGIGSLKLIDPAGGGELFVLKAGSNTVQAIAYSFDGQVVAAASTNDAAIRVWETATGRPRRTLNAPAVQVQCVAFSPDGRLLAAGSGVNVVLWDLTSGDQLVTLSGHTEEVTSLAFSPNGAFLVTGSGDGTLRVWRAAP